MARTKLQHAESFRRGIAPLEMVMSLPFLAGMVAMIMSIGGTTLYRSLATSTARHEVWKLRDDPNQDSPDLTSKDNMWTRPLGLENVNPLSGQIYGETEYDIKLSPGLGSATPKGRSAVLANTWDHKALALDGRGDFTGNGPHVGVLGRMGPGMAVAVTGLGNLRNMDLPNKEQIKDAQKEIDESERQQQKLMEEHRKKIEELKQKYEEVKKQRDQLIAEKKALEQKRDKLNEEIAQLEKQLADQNPPDPSLVAKIKEKKAERDKLNGEISKKQREIDAKQREMDRIQREIDEREAVMRDAEEEIGKLE